MKDKGEGGDGGVAEGLGCSAIGPQLLTPVERTGPTTTQGTAVRPPSPTIHLADTARTGREKQAFTADGTRRVAGVVPMLASGQVVLVSSASHPKRWIFPKGGAETDESLEESALREAWEEAGVKGTLVGSVGCLPHDKCTPRLGSAQEELVPVAEFHFFCMDVTELCEVYPESGSRRRMVASVEEARTLLSKPYMVEFLERCLRLKRGEAGTTR